MVSGVADWGASCPQGGCVKERDFGAPWDSKMDGLMNGERGAIKCPLGWLAEA